MNTRSKALCATLTLALGIGVGALGHAALSPAAEPVALTPACPTEDSQGCYWDATAHGDGTGRSFYTDADDVTYYATDCTALAAWADRITAAHALTLTLWEQGTPYQASLSDDAAQYAAQLQDALAQCQ